MPQDLGNGNPFMPIQDQVGVRPLETDDDWVETRLEALGYIFHGTVPLPESRRAAARAGSNLLHFARCPKLDKVASSEARIWFRTISIAKQQLDEMVGGGRWKWCKLCEREITQKIINER
jgi:hypothetical protein